jgi:hypothetical protein
MLSFLLLANARKLGLRLSLQLVAVESGRCLTGLLLSKPVKAYRLPAGLGRLVLGTAERDKTVVYWLE